MPADIIKVLPNAPEAVGMKHPHAEPLEEAGSLWPLDSFTCRRLADRSVRRAEVEAAAPAPTGKGGKTKPADAGAAETPAA